MFVKYEVKITAQKTLASQCDLFSFCFLFNSPAVCIYLLFNWQASISLLACCCYVATCFLDNYVFCLLVAMAMTLTRRTHTLHRSRMYKIETLLQYKLFHLDNLYNIQQFPISFIVFNAKSRIQLFCTIVRFFFLHFKANGKNTHKATRAVARCVAKLCCSDNDQITVFFTIL